MTHPARALFHTLFAAFAARDLPTVEACFAPDYRGRDAGTFAPIEGREQALKMFSLYLLAFPNLQLELLEVVEQGERAVAVFHASGTHGGSLLNIPTTGKNVAFEGTWTVTVRGGALLEGDLRWDMAKLLRDLGLLPDLPAG